MTIDVLDLDADWILPGGVWLIHNADEKTFDGREVVAGDRPIWSIGKRMADGAIFASVDCRFYGDPDYECIWLR